MIVEYMYYIYNVFKVVALYLKALHYGKQFLIMRIILYFWAIELLAVISNKVLMALSPLAYRL